MILRLTFLTSRRRRWSRPLTLLNVGLLLLMLGLGACERAADAPAPRAAAPDERPSATAVSGTTSGTPDFTPRHSACLGWAFAEECDSAVSVLHRYAMDTSYDWSRFAGNPEKLRDLEEERQQKVRALLSSEYVDEISGFFDNIMELFDQVYRSGAFVVRATVSLDLVEPIDEAVWSPPAARLRVNTLTESELPNGSVFCRSDNIQATLRRAGSDEPWLFDRGLLFPLDSQTRAGPCE